MNAAAITLQNISPFASIHQWLNRVKDGIQYQHAGTDGVEGGGGGGGGWEQESHVPYSIPNTNPDVAAAAEAVQKKAAPPSSSNSASSSEYATSLIRLYLHVNDVVRTMDASPIYNTLGTSPAPTMYMSPSKQQYTFDQPHSSKQTIALSISSHVLTESLLTSKTAFLSLLLNAPYTDAEQWNHALSIWSHWKSMIQPDATIMTNTPQYTFHVRVIYTKAPNWNGSEISSQTRCEKIRAYCLDAYHVLPMSHTPIGPITKLCEQRYPKKTLECILGRGIQSRYGWKCKLYKPDIQFLVTFQDDVMRIGITMYHASYSEYLTHLSHTGPHSILHSIQHIHDAALRWESPQNSFKEQSYHIHASIHLFHHLTLHMLRTKSFLNIIESSNRVLIEASKQGEVEMVHILIQLGYYQIGATNEHTLHSALITALSHDYYSTIALLLHSLHSIIIHRYDIMITFHPIIIHALEQRCILGVMQIVDYVEKRNWKNEKNESHLTSWFLAACATHDMILIEPFIMLYLRHHRYHAQMQSNDDVDQLSASIRLMSMTLSKFESSPPIATSTKSSCISEMNVGCTPFAIQLQHHIAKLAKLTYSTTLSVEPRFGARYVNTMKHTLMSNIHQAQKHRYDHERYGVMIPYIAYMSRDEINIIMSYWVGDMMEWK